MSIESLTDMRELEGGMKAVFCHIIYVENGQPICGCACDGADQPLHAGDWWTERCDGCGRRNCPDCRETMERIW